MGKKLVTKSELLKAIRKIGANHTAIGRSLGITRQAVAKRIESDGDLKKAYEDQRERIWMKPKTSLPRQFEKGRVGRFASCFRLLVRAGDTRRELELSGNVGGQGQIVLHLPDNGRDNDDREDSELLRYSYDACPSNGATSNINSNDGCGGNSSTGNATENSNKGGISTMGKENAREAKLRLMFQEMALGIREVPPELEELYRTKNIGRSFASRFVSHWTIPPC